MMTFRLDDKAYSCPQSLKECDWRQVAAVMGYQIAASPQPPPDGGGAFFLGDDVKMVHLKRELFCFLTGVPIKVLKKLTVEQGVRVFSMISWCRNAEIRERPFEYFEFSPPAPSGGARLLRYYLPAENFGDMSCIELAMANIFLISLGKGNKNAVLSLMATICRPERSDIAEFRAGVKWDGDRRVKYNSVVADEAAVAFENGLEIGVAVAVLRYFGYMNEQFFKANAILTASSDASSDASSASATDGALYQNGEGQITMLMEIGGMNIFGNFEAVCEQNVHTVYLFLRDKQLKLNRIEAEAENETEE